MTKRMIVMLICVGILFGGIFGYKAFKSYMIGKYIGALKNPTVTVSAKKVDYQSWQPQLHAAASLRAVRGVDVTTEITGLVRAICFKPGADVKEGQLLVELIDDTDMARLRSLEANAGLAKTVYRRDRAQYAIRAVSKAVVDSDAANLKSTEAQVEEQAAVVEKKTIRAPFSGRLGISQINIGQHLNPGDKIVTLQTLSPIYVDFYVPQQQVAQLSVGQAILMEADMAPAKIFRGKITTINPKVEVETRNVEVEATVLNPQCQLLPGMFTNVLVKTGKPEQFLTLPQAAISYNPYGDIVYVIKEKGKDDKGKPILTVMQTFVTVGKTRGDQVSVLKGLNKGDLVVTGGQLKLKNGSRVVINNSIVPSNDPAPSFTDQ
jgi:membrane fusion protein (multidrug efflux system)